MALIYTINATQNMTHIENLRQLKSCTSYKDCFNCTTNEDGKCQWNPSTKKCGNTPKGKNNRDKTDVWQ